jgi:hypothetical protein
VALRESEHEALDALCHLVLRLLLERRDAPLVHLLLARLEVLTFPRGPPADDDVTRRTRALVEPLLELSADDRRVRPAHDAPREVVRAPVHHAREETLGDDQVLNREHDNVRRAGRQDRCRDDRDLLRGGGERVELVVDVVEHDEVGTLLVDLGAASCHVQAERVDGEPASSAQPVPPPAADVPILA